MSTVKFCLACNREFEEHSDRCPDDGTLLISLKPEIEIFKDDRFEVLDVIGKGRFARIFRAARKSDKHVVALKNIMFAPVEKLQMHAEEAHCLSRLNHPGIVRLLDHGQKTGNDYLLVLDYIGSETVQSLLDKQGLIPLDQMQSIMSPLCDALSYLYQEGQVHPFLKPSHIVLDDTDRKPVLVDFAKQYYAHGVHTFSVGASIVFNGEYAAPEVLVGEPITERSNIYSLGCIIYAMLFGQPPFQSDNQLALAAMHLHNEVPRPTQLIRSLNTPKEIDTLIMSMLEKKPENRPTSIAKVRQSLS